MSLTPETERFIAVKECAGGNETVGTAWVSAKSFPASTPISEVWQWANSIPGGKGRLMLTEDEK